MITINTCPICMGTDIHAALICQDYTVSNQKFTIAECKKCSLRITTPRPEEHEIAYYYESSDYISHTAEARSVLDHIYQIARRHALRWKEKLITSRINSHTNRYLMDYGCGTGSFATHMAKQEWIVTGIEPSAKAREAIPHMENLRALENLEQNTHAQFDVITLWHVLEHIPDLDHLLQQLKNLLSSDGLLVVAVPNYKSWDGSHYQEFWAGYDVPRHLWHFSQHSMQGLSQKNGLRIVETIPMKLDAYYISLLSEKYIRKKNSLLGLINATINGFRSNLKARNNSDFSSIIYIMKK